MTATRNGAAPEESAAPPDDLTARQVGDQRIEQKALDRYLNAIFGDGIGYAHLARGTKPYLSESGRYAFGRNWGEDAFAWPERRAELVKMIEQAVADDADVYLCPYLMKGEKRTKGTAVERRLAHADIDGEIDVAKVTQLGGFAISSGSEGHGHAYVALSAPVDARQHEALCRALGPHLG